VPLKRAFGLDWNLDIGIRRARTSRRLDLLEARLVTRDLDVFRIYVFAETGYLVGTEQIDARHHPAAALDPDRYLGVSHGGTVGVLHETKIGRSFILAGIIVVAESGPPCPGDAGQQAHCTDEERRQCHTASNQTHSGSPDGSRRPPAEPSPRGINSGGTP